MDKDKFLSELKKLLSDKKINNVLAILLVLIFLLLAYNVFSPNSNKEVNKSSKEDFNSSNVEKVSTSQYEAKEKEELISILEEIEGVGEVTVKINFEGDEVKVPAYEDNTQTSNTEETDTSGGKRKNEQTNESKTVVKSEDEPYILQTKKPKVVGIAVAAEGASDSKVKNDIEKAVCSLYDLPINKVNVYPMKK